jgi:hypothetical protein
MTPAAPPPSTRLLRAADAERAELARHRERLLTARETLRAELARVEGGLVEVDERQRLLDRLAPRDDGANADSGGVRPGAAQSDAVPLHHELASAVAGRDVLRGPAIREVAVRLLLARPEGIEALHYRDWFDLVNSEGFVVAGKDPLAVFLTQISRSPVVRRSTQSGVYEVDRDAASELRRRLNDLHERLRALAMAPAAAADLAQVRTQRQKLTTEIGHVEKALEEASRLLEAEPAAELASVG